MKALISLLAVPSILAIMLIAGIQAFKNFAAQMKTLKI
jgi:hypothetical protein